jgi:hypothetical protein
VLIGNCNGAGRPLHQPIEAVAWPGDAMRPTRHRLPGRVTPAAILNGVHVSWSGAPSEFLVEAWVCQAS